MVNQIGKSLRLPRGRLTGLTRVSFLLITPIETRTRAFDLGRSHHGNVPPSPGVLLVSSTLLRRPTCTGWIRHHPGEKTDIRLPTSRSALDRVKIKLKPNLIYLGLDMSLHGWAELPPLEVGYVSFFVPSSQALLTEGAQNSSTRQAREEQCFRRFMGPYEPLFVLRWSNPQVLQTLNIPT